MAEVSRASEFWSELKDLKRRIADLERSSQLPNSSIDSGSLTVRDEDQGVIGYIGDSSVNPFYQVPGGSTGIYSSKVDDVRGAFWHDNVEGTMFPWATRSWAPVNEFLSTTSGTFVSMWESYNELVTSKRMRTRMGVACDVGTTGEVRLSCPLYGATTDTIAITSVFSSVLFNWFLSSLSIGEGPVLLEVQARRLTGAGNVHIYRPSDLAFGYISTATATGV